MNKRKYNIDSVVWWINNARCVLLVRKYACFGALAAPERHFRRPTHSKQLQRRLVDLKFIWHTFVVYRIWYLKFQGNWT